MVEAIECTSKIRKPSTVGSSNGLCDMKYLAWISRLSVCVLSTLLYRHRGHRQLNSIGSPIDKRNARRPKTFVLQSVATRFADYLSLLIMQRCVLQILLVCDEHNLQDFSFLLAP